MANISNFPKKNFVFSNSKKTCFIQILHLRERTGIFLDSTKLKRSTSVLGKIGHFFLHNGSQTHQPFPMTSTIFSSNRVHVQGQSNSDPTRMSSIHDFFLKSTESTEHASKTIAKSYPGKNEQLGRTYC